MSFALLHTAILCEIPAVFAGIIKIKLQFPRCPLFLSTVKIIELPETRVDLMPHRAQAPLAAIAADGLKHGL